jgi:hypothetical protein
VTTARTRKSTKRRPSKPKKKSGPGRRGTIVTMVHPPPRSTRARVRPHEREVVGLRCRVVAVHPDAEAVVLTDFYGRQVLVPVTSVQRDGRFARDLAGLVGRDVWLSLRLP